MYIKEKVYQVILKEIMHSVKSKIKMLYYIILMTIIYCIQIYINY